MQIQTIFLDAGGVLVHPNWERVRETLARHGIVVSAERLRKSEPIIKKSIDTEAIIRATNDGGRFETYLRNIILHAGVSETENIALPIAELIEYNNSRNLWETTPSDVFPTLAALRGMGMKLVVLSNSNGTLRESFGRFGLLDKVDYLFDSNEVGFEKPDPAYFLHALGIAGASAESTLHVGDFYHVDVMGARSAGIRPVLLDEANLYEGYDCERIRTLSDLLCKLVSA
jgi:putative hydrolase of the HAD superfamily